MRGVVGLVLNPACSEAACPAASKYERRPVALLWPTHLVSSALVPMRVSTRRARMSDDPLNVVGGTELNGTTIRLADEALRTIPVMHRAWPNATTAPFLSSSVRMSNW